MSFCFDVLLGLLIVEVVEIVEDMTQRQIIVNLYVALRNAVFRYPKCNSDMILGLLIIAISVQNGIFYLEILVEIVEDSWDFKASGNLVCLINDLATIVILGLELGQSLAIWLKDATDVLAKVGLSLVSGESRLEGRR